MTDSSSENPDLRVEVSGHVAQVEVCRPPDNFFDGDLIHRLADVCDSLDARHDCRAIVICSQGKHFCAGYRFSAKSLNSDGGDAQGSEAGRVYAGALRLFSLKKPVIAAVQGAAIGGGLGLALWADFRVTCAEARFSANFARLGFHHGFGLSLTLPRAVGPSQADLLLLTGRRIDGVAATRIGLANELVPRASVRTAAMELAAEITQAAPLAVLAIRETQRKDLVAAMRKAIGRELKEQERLKQTSDFREGIAASVERRAPEFHGK